MYSMEADSKKSCHCQFFIVFSFTLLRNCFFLPACNQFGTIFKLLMVCIVVYLCQMALKYFLEYIILGSIKITSRKSNEIWVHKIAKQYKLIIIMIIICKIYSELCSNYESNYDFILII